MTYSRTCLHGHPGRVSGRKVDNGRPVVGSSPTPISIFSVFEFGREFSVFLYIVYYVEMSLSRMNVVMRDV
jgi:hypothetical protein